MYRTSPPKVEEDFPKNSIMGFSLKESFSVATYILQHIQTDCGFQFSRTIIFSQTYTVLKVCFISLYIHSSL